MKIFGVRSYSTRIPVGSEPSHALDAEEGGLVSDARGLLHVVGHDHDRVRLLQRMHQILDARGCDRVERRGRLVHQDHVGLDGERAGDAQALLLAARERQRASLQPVLDLVPERGPLQRAVHTLVEVAAHPERARPVRDVVVDRLRERVRALEDHADPLSHLDRVDSAAVEVESVVEDRSRDLRPGDDVVHAVQAADERALPAAGGADDRGHLVRLDLERDVSQHGPAVVAHREVADVEDRLVAHPGNVIRISRPSRLVAST